ncbi:MAG: hypothetical protein J0M12_07675 [Deltaproteobacteria bacterium]|nr:hypothetical protein [Deltaproteobacteria bacterium]
MAYQCYKCGAEQALSDRRSVGRTESCLKCASDLHCCRNCSFYDEKAYNSCREPQADRVLEKNRSNFCDFFEFAADRSMGTDNAKNKALDALNDLFKK